jgi:preprotein translocase subunit SecY
MKFVDTIKNIWKIEDLKKRLMFTIMIVLVYRFGCHVVLPGISATEIDALRHFTSGGLMQLLDMFSGGAFSQASIFALGIMPYITASIVIQLLGMVLPSFQKMQREGESGHNEAQSVHALLDSVHPAHPGTCLPRQHGVSGQCCRR